MDINSWRWTNSPTWESAPGLEWWNGETNARISHSQRSLRSRLRQSIPQGELSTQRGRQPKYTTLKVYKAVAVLPTLLHACETRTVYMIMSRHRKRLKQLHNFVRHRAEAERSQTLSTALFPGKPPTSENGITPRARAVIGWDEHMHAAFNLFSAPSRIVWSVLL